MRISDWSSDVCSSDLRLFGGHGQEEAAPQPHEPAQRSAVPVLETAPPTPAQLATETEPVITPAPAPAPKLVAEHARSEEPTYELQSLMRISYPVVCSKKQNTHK